MKLKTTLRLLAAFVALATFAVACSSDNNKTTSGSSGSGAASSAPAADFVALGGWNDGACSTSQPKVVVGITEPIDTAGVSLKDYVDGTQAAVEAFNKRGGISGRCLDLIVCDGKGDGPTELACARQETENTNMVAGLASTITLSEADAYQLFESAGLPQIGAQVTQPGAWNSPVSYEFTMGGSGTLLAGVPALKSVGVTKFVYFVPASGQIGALATFATPMVNALGMNLVATIQIPPTAVEFTQFILTAQNAGAEGGVLGASRNRRQPAHRRRRLPQQPAEARGRLGNVLPEGRQRGARGNRKEHGIHRRRSACRIDDPVQVAHLQRDQGRLQGVR